MNTFLTLLLLFLGGLYLGRGVSVAEAFVANLHAARQPVRPFVVALVAIFWLPMQILAGDKDTEL